VHNVIAKTRKCNNGATDCVCSSIVRQWFQSTAKLRLVSTPSSLYMQSTATRTDPFVLSKRVCLPLSFASWLMSPQGVKGFPTVKLFPRGKEQAPILFEHPDRSASAFFYFAARRVPHKNKKLYTVEEIEPWASDVCPSF
jgi:hypothetical protein